MADEVASFYLMVVLAMSDHELHDKEAKEIKEIANKYKIDFDPYEAASEINYHFKNDFNKACNYYMPLIQNTNIQKDTIDFIKKIIYSDTKIDDNEVKILEECRKRWGSELKP